MARKSKAAKGSVKVNFKGVESRRTPPEGDYKCSVLEATSGTSANKNDQIEFVAEIASGEFKGQKLYLYCPLQENSLWKLHAFLTALGQDVPEDDMDIDLSELVGEEFMGVITHETYNGRKRAKLTDFDSVDNYDGKDEEDDKKSSKKSSKKDEDDDDKPAKGKKSKKEEPEDPYEDLDEDELREAVIDRELATKKEAKKLDEDELKELLTDDDEASAKKSSKKGDDKADKKGGKKKAKKYDKDEVEDMDEDELQELIDESKIDVDLDDYKKLPKKVAAVIEALEEADLLDD